MLASFQSFALCYLVIAGFSASQQLMLSDVDYFMNSRRSIVGVFVFFYLVFCVFQFGIVSFVEFFILHTPESDVKCCTLLHKVKSYPSVFTYNCVSVFSIFCIVSFGNCSFLHATAIDVK